MPIENYNTFQQIAAVQQPDGSEAELVGAPPTEAGWNLILVFTATGIIYLVGWTVTQFLPKDDGGEREE